MSDIINHTNRTNIDRVNNFFEVFGYIILGIISTLIIIYIIALIRIRFECCDNFLKCLMSYHPNFRNHNRIEINHSNSIEMGNIVSYDEIQFDSSCAICLELLNQGDIYKLKCNHCFHLECWNQWDKAVSKSVCPVCRFEI